MASIKPHTNGYRAAICVKGTRETACFRTKREASLWAASREIELRSYLSKPKSQQFTLADALKKYAREITPSKRGARWELIRIEAFLKSNLPIDLPIADCTASAISAWRDDRLKTLTNNSVRRELSILSPIFEVARKEWGWIDHNPVANVRKPRSSDHRDVIISRKQIKMMLLAFGYAPNKPIRTMSQCCAMCFLIALRTGMRAGEITKLKWSRVFDGYCELTVTKTVPRNVPLDFKSERLINKMRGFDDVLVFGVKAATLDARFRTVRTNAGLSGFTFHDARHTAATWLAQRLSLLDLCKMFGWATTKQALTYYNPHVTDITKRLNAPK